MEGTKLSLQTMSRLCFLCRLCKHILTNSNALFVEKQGGWFLLMKCVEGVHGE